jgi:hypothetical protein
VNMAEIKDLVKIGIAGVALGLVALIVAGFYFTITGATGQGFLVGQFESFAEAIFNFISAPFIASERSSPTSRTLSGCG